MCAVGLLLLTWMPGSAAHSLGLLPEVIAMLRICIPDLPSSGRAGVLPAVEDRRDVLPLAALDPDHIDALLWLDQAGQERASQGGGGIVAGRGSGVGGAPSWVTWCSGRRIDLPSTVMMECVGSLLGLYRSLGCVFVSLMVGYAGKRGIVSGAFHWLKSLTCWKAQAKTHKATAADVLSRGRLDFFGFFHFCGSLSAGGVRFCWIGVLSIGDFGGAHELLASCQ